ncbi:hypothetical protein [Thermogemmatispora tikiterensis]|uniref:Uncharacterized protein n=1 Tax=Thermogemmatispora tikiterensis TaxID=1825093 RepID=A0A328VKJ5_9CHLR|nr:hypothetical protein [Thermogemmatispora tikiterensis]RAQ97967.1 hypothetical protein A4R35_20680 [Thermogemmatispora tikiterensis]
MLRTIFALVCFLVLFVSDVVLWLRVWRLPSGQERGGQLIGAVGGLIALLAASLLVFLTLKGGS